MSVMVAALVAVVVVLAMGTLAVASAAEAARRAAQAADLASLAGAIRLRDSGDPLEACRVAATIAAANSASLGSCVATGGVDVTARCSARSRWGVLGVGRVAERSSRAGPDP